ncbi:MAG: response regulator [Planctomycetes bacterium]|nr:response regulator [Planctomycetota bacterium]NOG52847.1 response regulator [Planctomycetota bacterium]
MPEQELKRILIADDELLVIEGTARSLRELGYEVIGPVPDGEQAIETCRDERPDMALLDIQMPRMSGLDAAKIIFSELGIPVVIISAYSDPEYAKTSARIGVFGYLVKPINEQDLRVTLSVAWGQFLSHHESNDQITKLTQRLEDRKTIERAKWVLVEHIGITEQDAMQRLQKQARDNRRTLVDVARGILENHELFTGQSR